MTHQPHNMLVTGGAGFIGSNFVRHVMQAHAGIRVVNLDKLTYAGSLSNLPSLSNDGHHHFVTGDICDRELVRHLLREFSIDTIVHFAAESHVDRSIQSPQSFVETNVTGTFVLLEAAREYWREQKNISQRFHHISTDEVYGSLDLEEEAFTEKTAYQPRSPYAASKAASDHLVQAYHHTYRLPVTISNCSNNYGPYQHAEKFIPTIIRSCLQHQAIPIYGKGKNIRDWLYVDDHCHAIMTILLHGANGETYNIGGNNEWENLTLVQHICLLLDKMMPRDTSYTEFISFVPDRPGHDFRYAINDTKLRHSLRWAPLTSMQLGLEKTIKFYADAMVMDQMAQL